MTPEPGREALAAIVAGLEGVTPGKWRSSETEPPGQACIHSKGSPYQIATAWNGRENFPYRKNAAHIARCHPEAIRSIADYVAKVEARATTAEARAETAEALSERLRLEAQGHAMEARTANSTIAEIYQAVTGSTGEPGNWHGAAPVRLAFEALRERVAVLEGLVLEFTALRCVWTDPHNDELSGRAFNALKREIQNAD